MGVCTLAVVVGQVDAHVSGSRGVRFCLGRLCAYRDACVFVWCGQLLVRACAPKCWIAGVPVVQYVSGSSLGVVMERWGFFS